MNNWSWCYHFLTVLYIFLSCLPSVYLLILILNPTTSLDMCHDLSLQFATKAKTWKSVGRECNLRVTLTLTGVWEGVKEGAHTLSNGLPLWELESLWTFEFLKSNLKGENSLDWKLLYIIEKLLKHKYLKWVHMIHLSIYNTSYGWKKNQKSKCQFDFQLLKVKNRLKLRVCRWHATYHWKAPHKGYNVVWNLTLIGSLHKKWWVSKMAKFLISRIPRFLTWES
jgi:hypothetical protein